jgi:mono/diheme cytochrome c family protein
MRDALAVGAAALAALLGLTALDGSLHAAEQTDAQNFAQIERGRYLAEVADCVACHIEPTDNRPFAGGRPIETPFGIIVASNITPDRDTGIGAWSDDEFVAAVRRGVRRDGRLLYPAMPYPSYTKMSRDDVLAIRAYLNTVAPVRNAVEANQLPFPLNIRAGMRFWDGLYFTEGEFKPDPTRSDAWNRGAYLVEGAAHCGTCHTPKTLLGGDKTSAALQGYAIQGWFAPDITNDVRLGLGQWTTEDIVEYLRTGHNRFVAATGPMAEEITHSSSHMTDADLAAIAAYLKEQPSETHEITPVPADDPVMIAGGAIYRDLCSACHTVNGNGIPYLFPALANSPSVRSTDPTTVIRIILRGARSVATTSQPTAPAMPSFDWQLGDERVAAVATYIRNSWGSAAPAVSATEVGKVRSALVQRTD